MNNQIDRMLSLTASIAEQLLRIKDMGLNTLDEHVKLEIIDLAELAASIPDAAMPCVESSVVAEPHTECIDTDSVGGNIPEADDENGNTDDTTALNAIDDDTQTSDAPPVDATLADPITASAPIAEENEISPEPGDDRCQNLAAEPDLTLWRQAFSINDMYLFRHELFRDSDMLFNQALADLGQARDPMEVRQILVDRYGIDPRGHSAKEFIAIISAFFQ